MSIKKTILIYDIKPPVKITVDRIGTQGGLYTSKTIIDLRRKERIISDSKISRVIATVPVFHIKIT